MENAKTRQQLQALLCDQLGEAQGARVVEAVVSAADRPDALHALLVLLNELQEVSGKAARAASDALPELDRRGAMPAVVPWLDLGLALAERSGAAALKYFKESPLLLGLVEAPTQRETVLAIALELVEDDYASVLEFLRVAPELARTLPADELQPWAALGIELMARDQVVGIEFLRQLPAISPVLSRDQIRSWIEFGLKLVTTNSLGKTDYFGTVEFFRTSPGLLAEIEPKHLRAPALSFCSRIADWSLETGTTCLAETPRLLNQIPSEKWQEVAIQYGMLIAERDAQSALAYLRRVPEVLSLVLYSSETRVKFDEWFKTGMEVLGYNVEAGRAYFAMESHKALAAVGEALSGVPLRQIARALTLFAQALCGREVTIRAMEQPADSPQRSTRPTVSADGRTISLPAILRRYDTYVDNVRLYTVMTAHEVGHLEFGTYDVDLSRLADLIQDVGRRYGHHDAGSVHTLAEVFAWYPQPGLIRDLWTLLEDARVECHLRRAYPGLSRDLTKLAQEAVTTRSLNHGLTARELAVDALLLLTTAEPGTFTIPDAIRDVVDRLWPMTQQVCSAEATAADAIRVADTLYLTLEAQLGTTADMALQDDAAAQSDPALPGPQASDETSRAYQPLSNWEFRGTMHPELIREQGQPEAEDDDGGGVRLEEPRGQERAPTGGTSRHHLLSSEPSRGKTAFSALVASHRESKVFDDVLAVQAEGPQGDDDRRSPARGFSYPEWDGGIQDYRAGWCRVTERPGSEGSLDVVESILSDHGAQVRLLRRYFETFRPLGLQRRPAQVEGDDLDMDAVIRSWGDLAAGGSASDRLYTRIDKQERDVAVALLIDVSGSTSRVLPNGRRVIDVERDSLAVLCQALDAVGDQYAIYAYSGQGRFEVEFSVVKDFDELMAGQAAQRLAGIAPRQQNRDGAAIRHAVGKLMVRRAKTRLLMLLSDGRPLDDGYNEEYAIEDTKMALREAQMKGIEPFCITVDHEADVYLRRMYGDVRFMVIDCVEALPERLPRIYHRLTA